MSRTSQLPDDLAAAFRIAFSRLQISVETACAEQDEWAAKVAAVIRAALAFAAAHPVDADLLTGGAMAAGREGFALHHRMLDRFAQDLRAGRPADAELPALAEQAMVGGLAALIATRLSAPARLPALAPGAIQFILAPYVGMEEARRIAAEAG